MRKKENSQAKTRRLGKRAWALVLSALVAVALCVTCGLCINLSPRESVTLDNPQEAAVEHSVTDHGALTENDFYNRISGGTAVQNDTFTYGPGKSYTINLYPGTYKFEAWGGGGGNDNVAAGSASAGYSYGGNGGYTWCNYTVSSKTPIYISVGNKGADNDSGTGGGYNGGGSAGTSGGSGAGGGATHYATTSGTIDSANRSYFIIVAGGAGGGGYSCYKGGDGGGGNNAGGNGAGANNGSAGTGGKTNAVGSTHSLTNTCLGSPRGAGDGAGAGAGYYGGGAPTGDGGAGGGSGYIKSGLTGGGTTGGNSSTARAAGKAVITMLFSPNSNPVQANPVKQYTTSVGSTLTVKASEIATDSHGVYMSDGATNRDTITSMKFYFNSALSASADDYFTSYTRSSAQIAAVLKRFPRASDTYISTDGEMTLYTRVRDGFGDNTTRGLAVVSFKVTVSRPNLKQVSGSATYSSANRTYTYTYNGSGTASISNAILYGDTVQLDLTKMVTNPNTSYYNVYATVSAANTTYFNYGSSSGTTFYAHSSGTSYSGATTGYTSLQIKSVKSTPTQQSITLTFYLVEKSSYKGTNYEVPGTTYQTSASGSWNKQITLSFSLANARPTLTTTSTLATVEVGKSQTVNLTTMFSDADHTFGTKHSIQEIKVPDKEIVFLNQSNNVVSAAGKGGASGSASCYNVAPAGTALTNANTTGVSSVNTGFSNKIAIPASGATAAQKAEAFMTYSYSGMNVTINGLRPSYSLYSSSRGTAITGGTMSAPTGTGTVTNLGHFYLIIRIKDDNDPADTGIWLPLAVKVGTTQLAPVNTGTVPGTSTTVSGATDVSQQGVVTDLPKAEGEIGDSFYFIPMAINLSGTQYKMASKVMDGATEIPSTKWTALAQDADNFAVSSGLSSWNSHLNEFLTITSTPNDVVTSIRTATPAKEYIQVSTVKVYVPKSWFGGRVLGGASAVADTSGTGIHTVAVTTEGDFYVTTGLKITLNACTMNRYVYATVNMKDCAGVALKNTVNIAIKVGNTAPNIVAADKVATGSDPSKYTNVTYNNDTIPTIRYEVPLRTTFMITPYDLVRDASMTDCGVTIPDTFTLNGLAGAYEDGKFTVGGSGSGSGTATAVTPVLDPNVYGGAAYTPTLQSTLNSINTQKHTVKALSTGATFSSSAAADDIYSDRLYFKRTDDNTRDPYTFTPSSYTNMSASAIANGMSGYVYYYAGDTVNINSVDYPLDFFVFYTHTRTVGAASLTVTVHDRYGNETSVRVLINVVNVAPTRKTAVPATELITVPGTGGISINVGTFAPEDVMSDVDDANISFITGRQFLVLRGAGHVLTGFNESDISGLKDGNGVSLLCDKYGNSLKDKYISVEMTKATEIKVTALCSTQAIEEGVFIYFFVVDDWGDTALGYKQVEVHNSAPEFNEGDDGFIGPDYTWSISAKAGSNAVTRPRYIVSSDDAKDSLVADKGAGIDDIRSFGSDPDKLQGLVLSQRGASVSKYFNYTDSYETAVPKLLSDYSIEITPAQGGNPAVMKPAYTYADDKPAAINLYLVKNEVNTYLDTGIITPTLMFYVGGTWYERDDLVTALGTNTSLHDLCFDDNGLWTLRDWALKIVSNGPFESEGATFKLAINISMRDDAKYGGDTAGKADIAYDVARPAKKVISGRLATDTVYMYISGTGIHTKASYNNYGGYYVVEDGDTAKYLPYKTASGVAAKQYVDAADAADTEGAFKFENVIEVPGDINASNSYDTVYVPMSYFGMLDTLSLPDTTNGIAYSSSYVAYDLSGGLPYGTGEGKYANGGYSKGSIDDVIAALELYDGRTTWKGSDIVNNPYITIDAFDDTATNSLARFTGTISEPYYNGLLSVLSADYDTTKSIVSDNLIGPDDKLLYLANQATNITEHNFGLSFTKKNVRTGTVNLKLTVNLSQSMSSGNSTKMSINDANKWSDTNSVFTWISVGNTPVELVKKTTTGTNLTPNNIVEYDEERGTYYTDIRVSSSGYAVYNLVRKNTIMLDVEGVPTETVDAAYNDSVDPTYKKIYYYDRDYQRGNSRYRDTAYFSYNSMSALADMGDRPRELNEDNTAFVNTAAKAEDQSSMLNYYNVSGYAGMSGIGNNYDPNAYEFGSDLTRRYSSYFTVSTESNSKVLRITAARKTYINESALKKLSADELGYTDWTDGTDANNYGLFGGLTQAQIAQIYNARGLEVEFDNDDDNNKQNIKINRVYYPFRMLIYDSCGAGWDSASYTSIEFRIQIVNTDPELKTNVGVADTNGDEGDRLYEFSLNVTGTARFNLHDFISDPDIMVLGSTGAYRLATESDFSDLTLDTLKSRLDYETSDYLESPYVNNYDSEMLTQEALENGMAGFAPSNYDTADVIMYMPTAGATNISTATKPSQNYITFKVNRRTTDASGNIVKSFDFKLKFRDNHYDGVNVKETKTLTFRLTVTNETPTVTTNVSTVTMYINETMTVLPTYYDTFVGGMSYLVSEELDDYKGEDGKYLPDYYDSYANGTRYSFPKLGSTSFLNSLTYKELYAQNIGNDRDSDWDYSYITSDVYGENATGPDKFIKESDGTKSNLGFLALASDDTPWRLRFESVPNVLGNPVLLSAKNTTEMERSAEYVGNTRGPMAINIKADKACENQPVVFRLVDGEGGVITHTIYFTVKSKPPEARSAETEARVLALSHLEGVKDNSDEYITATYSTYIIPGGPSGGVPIKLSSDAGEVTRTAYTTTKITLKQVAKDSDGDNQTNNLSLFGDGDFKVNNKAMMTTTGGFVSDYFDIAIVNDPINGNGFTITAKGYNRDSAYEELTFLIADSGNPSRNNALQITIHVYTVYSTMQTTAIRGSMGEEQKKNFVSSPTQVHVRAYDEYIGLGQYTSSTHISEPSDFTYVAFDGNTAPLVDPDVSTSGTQTYSAYLYAFVDVNGEPLAATELVDLFDWRNDAMSLKSRAAVRTDYLIGGIDENGLINEGNINTLNAVLKYVDFTISSDGTKLSFVPKTGSLGGGLLLYVEVEKRINSRDAKRTDTTAAGTLFKLIVDDSAPRTDSAENHQLVGPKGSTATFKIHDPSDTRGSLFIDSDLGDRVIIEGFDPNDLTNKDYVAALGAAQAASLDWRADATPGVDKGRAFTITVDNDAGTLTITIDRRMDAVDDSTGKFLDEVTFTLSFTGKDIEGNTATVTIEVTVCNSEIDALNRHYPEKDVNGVGYSFVRNYEVTDVREYTLDATIIGNSVLDINFADFLIDFDYVDGTDIDSFRLVASTRANGGFDYLVDDTIDAVYIIDKEFGVVEPLAEVEPLYTVFGTGKYEHHMHTGIRIRAKTSVRNHTGTLYMRLLDRASSDSGNLTGIYIRLNVIIVNEAPQVKEGMLSTYYDIMGSDTAPVTVKHDIKEFVTDNNVSDYNDMLDPAADKNSKTYLRVYSITYLDYTDLWSTEAAVLPGAGMAYDSSLLFNISYGTDINAYQQTFAITPNKGYYGTGAFEVTIADGNINDDADTEFTYFRVTISVMYDPSVIPVLNPMSTPRGKTQVLTIEKLIPDIVNTFEEPVLPSPESMPLETARVRNAASTSFNPSSWYVLDKVYVDKSDEAYIDIKPLGNNEWSLRATAETSTARTVHVEYHLKSNPNPDVKESSYFMLTVTANMQPVLRFKEIVFERYPESASANPLTVLNTDNTVYLSADQLFTDEEDDVITFKGAKSNKSALVSASTVSDGELLAIKFTARGYADITITVTDEVDKPYSYVIRVVNNDLAEPSLWTRLLASFESNKVMWAVIIGCVILAILILIIVIAVVRKRKHDREELEALLVSEMEIEEQMLRLAGAPSPTGYQSFGYLQSAPGQFVDPSMLLGTGNEVDPNQLGLAPPPPNGAAPEAEGDTPPDEDFVDDFDADE